MSPDINVSLLERELNYITINPKEWDQRHWMTKNASCGTAGCLAGNTLIHQGYTDVEWVPCTGDENSYFAINLKVNGIGALFSETAANELGLTEGQANVLFDASNSLYTLWYLANKFTDGEIKIPIDIEP